MSDFWNYLDACPILLVIVVVSTKISNFYLEDSEYTSNNLLYTVHSLASLSVWLKLIYFLRLFEQTGHLIRTLLGVFSDMKVFLFILSIVYMGFGEAFLRISEANDEDNRFLRNFIEAFVYLYRLSMGDFVTDPYENSVQFVYVWILFVIVGIILPIVMMNLLIAIVSKSFENINAKSELAAYQEKSRIIYENSYLISNSVKQ